MLGHYAISGAPLSGSSQTAESFAAQAAFNASGTLSVAGGNAYAVSLRLIASGTLAASSGSFWSCETSPVTSWPDTTPDATTWTETGPASTTWTCN